MRFLLDIPFFFAAAGAAAAASILPGTTPPPPNLNVESIVEAASKAFAENDTEDEERPKKKRKCVPYDRARAKKCVMDDWIGPMPRFDDKQFVRFYCITKSKFEYTLQELCKLNPYFTTTLDATKKESIMPEIKLLSALRSYRFGICKGAFRDYFQMGESTARDCCREVATTLLRCDAFVDKYLRKMSKADIERITQLHLEKYGVPNMLGSLDVMHVYWKNCPKGWQGQFQGKEGEPTICLEAFCDRNRWIWFPSFGYPGTLNDLNIWDQSPIHKAYLDGHFEERELECEIGGESFKILYILVDGIYPELACFLKTISVPLNAFEKYFTAWQEAVRKDIECAWGILQSKFRMCKYPCESRSKEEIQACVLTCIMLHNMMVEVRINNGEEEDISFYDVVPDEPSLGDHVTTSAAAATQEEEEVRQAQAEVAEGSRTMNKNLREKIETLRLLDFNTRVAQKRWEGLVNKKENQRLKDAVVRHLDAGRE